ncbi:unnamed protein product [Paramecium sonneborni]|uniref:Uncharacterized protein n=1 Tax=Paramecium sonneborni TaxID=65129 RepID=A0A8S1N337_9CILI|nr:unnamed protein product [Paramecium sonneborni]
MLKSNKQNNYMFEQNVGFINLVVDTYLNGIKLPGFAFSRGDAVAILLLVNKKMVLTQQFKVPVSIFTIEAPARMMDEQAAKEIKKEKESKFNIMKCFFYKIFQYLQEEMMKLFIYLMMKKYGIKIIR